MISVEQREKIRRAYFIEEKKIRQIAREFRCSRPTVRKAIASPEQEAYALTVSRPAPVLGPYKERIRELLVENERLPRKQRYTGHKIYQAIQKEGYAGSESTVRGYIAQLRQTKKRRKVYLPLEFDPGTDGQVDWGEGMAIIAGERVKVQLFYMRLCYSRKLFMMAFPNQKQEAFYEGHVRAFHHFNGYMRNRQIWNVQWRRFDKDRRVAYTELTQGERGESVVPAAAFPRFLVVGVITHREYRVHHDRTSPSCFWRRSGSPPRAAAA